MKSQELFLKKGKKFTEKYEKIIMELLRITMHSP